MKLTKRKTKKLLNQKGFSLVELMVVVAIIGILAAIAIPNYQRFQRKSQQTEPKTQMAGIYTAQVTFITEHGIGTNNILQSGFSPDGLVSYRVGFAHQAAGGSLGDPNIVTGTPPTGYRGPLARDVTLIDTIALCNSTYKDKCGLATAVGTGSVPWANFGTGSCVCTSASANPAVPCAPACANNAGNTACATHSGTGTCTWQAGNSGLLVSNGQRFKPTFTIGARGDIGGSQVDEWSMNESKVMLNLQDGSQ